MRIPKSRRHGRWLWLPVLCLLTLGAYWQRQYLVDRWKLLGYRPPAAVQQLATQDTMTAYARHLFWINHPAIDDASAFNQACAAQSEQTIVLGCYHGGENGIFVYRVTDPRLNGVEQVTAAHEMLHAAYERLSPGRRAYVDGLLEHYYRYDLHDPRLLAVMAAYKRTEPGDVVNEMHSVFGTEVANLPAPLEQYYKLYFGNRAAVVAYADGYQAEFSSREATVSQDDARLAQLKQQIDADNASLQTQAGNIDRLHSQLAAWRAAGNLTAYNTAVPEYNAQVDAYNRLAAATVQAVAAYNQLVAARNSLVVEVQSLAQAINSHTPAVPAR